jgi:hypothetical protein
MMMIMAKYEKVMMNYYLKDLTMKSRRKLQHRIRVQVQ